MKNCLRQFSDLSSPSPSTFAQASRLVPWPPALPPVSIFCQRFSKKKKKPKPRSFLNPALSPCHFKDKGEALLHLLVLIPLLTVCNMSSTKP